MSGFTNFDGSLLVGGKLPDGRGQSLAFESNGSLQVSATEQIRTWTLNGQSFSATTGKQTAATAITAGVGLFNPVGSGKTALLYSLKYIIGNNSFNILNLVTGDSAFSTPLIITNNRAGATTASVLIGNFTNTNVTPTGTTNDTTGSASNVLTQFFNNTDVLVLPPGNGIALYLNLSSANSWACTLDWVELAS